MKSKALLVVVGLIGLVGLAVALNGTSIQQVLATPGKVIVREREAARFQALDVTERALAVAPVPTGWDAGVYLSREMLNQTLVHFGSTTVRKTAGSGAGTQVEVKAVRLISAANSLNAEMDAVATVGQITIEFRILAAVMVAGFDRKGPNNTSQALLRVEPLEFEPTAQIGPFSFSLRGVWARLVPDLAILLADPEVFRTVVPLPDAFEVDLKIDQQDTTPVGDQGGTISWQASMPGSKINVGVTYSAPLFTPNGIWMLARLNGAGQPEITPPSTDGMTIEQLRQRNAEISSRIEAAVAALPPPRGEAQVFVSRSVFATAGTLMAGLTPDKLRVTIQTTGRNGNIAGQRWRDNILGEGGIEARLETDTGGAAAIQLAPPRATWEQGGLRLVLGAAVDARAPIRVHVDPLIGRGAGAVVGIHGRGGGAVTASAVPGMLSGSGRNIAIMTVRPECSMLRVDVATDGRFNAGFGFIRVPSMGARLGIPVGNQALPPIKLVDEAPQLVVLPAPAEPRRDEAMWVTTTSAAALIVSIKPISAVGDEAGVHIAADLIVRAVRRGATPQETTQILEAANKEVEEEQAKIREATAAVIGSSPTGPACEQKPEVAILLGNAEFGPNNEVVKFFVALGKLPQIFADVAERMGHELSADKIEGWLRDPGDALRRGDLTKWIPFPEGTTSINVPLPGGGSVDISSLTIPLPGGGQAQVPGPLPQVPTITPDGRVRIPIVPIPGAPQIEFPRWRL